MNFLFYVSSLLMRGQALSIIYRPRLTCGCHRRIEKIESVCGCLHWTCSACRMAPDNWSRWGHRLQVYGSTKCMSRSWTKRACCNHRYRSCMSSSASDRSWGGSDDTSCTDIPCHQSYFPCNTSDNNQLALAGGGHGCGHEHKEHPLRKSVRVVMLVESWWSAHQHQPILSCSVFLWRINEEL